MRDELAVQWAGQAAWLGLALAIVLLLAESWWPQRQSQAAFGRRWIANGLVLGVGIAVLRWLPQLSLIGAALLAADRGWGVVNWAHVPAVIAIPIAVLAIDLTGYAVHRLEHRSALLWRAHRLHHSDPDVDVTTTYRFHPFEIVLRAGAHVLVVLAVGVPPMAAVGYLLLSSLTSPLSHANVKLPRSIDQVLGWFVITPSIHRTHHSIDLDDASTNFAVCLSCWDRLLGTFRAAPSLGHARALRHHVR